MVDSVCQARSDSPYRSRARSAAARYRRGARLGDMADRPSSLFTLVEGGVAATSLARGPWSPDALHGGPVAALLAHGLQAMEGSGDFFPACMTVELRRPVTFEPHR